MEKQYNIKLDVSSAEDIDSVAGRLLNTWLKYEALDYGDRSVSCVFNKAEIVVDRKFLINCIIGQYLNRRKIDDSL